jgi:hypothetical protein
MKKYTVHSIKIENDVGKEVDKDGKERGIWGVILEDDDIPVGYTSNRWGHYIEVLRPEPRPELI